MTEEQKNLDVAVIGGGPAGMAAALILGRARLRTVVLNEENPRNAVSRASHGLLTRDGASSTELLAIAKEQLRPYESVAYHKQRAEKVERQGDGFRITAAKSVFHVRRLILATGFRDHLAPLALPGLEDVYGISAFPCPFCDGFEHADERWAVFMAEGAEHFAAVLRIWTDDLVVFTNGRTLSAETRTALEERGVAYDESRVRLLHSTGGKLEAVETEDRLWPRDAGFVGEEFAKPAAPFADELGVPRGANPWGRTIFEAQEGGATEVEGLYLVGDAHRQFGGLAAASYDGYVCAARIVHEVAMERWNAKTASIASPS